MTFTSIFCDWITVLQKHKPHKPFYDGVAHHTDFATGESRIVHKFKQIIGKHKSSVFIRSDGETVEFSGNPSRWNKKHNVTGISLDESKILINKIMVDHGLPKFTGAIVAKSGSIDYKGARFTRIDMTQNLKAGSPDNRCLYLQWVDTQNYGRLAKTTYSNMNICYGQESRYRKFRIYDKALEMRDKKKKPRYLSRKLDRIGAIRFELEYRKILKSRLVNLWNNATQAVLANQFIEDTEPMRKKIKLYDLSELPNTVKGTYAMYVHGYNPKQELSDSTFKRHKKILLRYGVDISCAIKRKPPIHEVIELEEITDDELKKYGG